MTVAIPGVAREAGHEYPAGIVRWLTTTNHKDLGILYMSFGLIMFLVGGLFIMAVRAELLFPGLQLLSPSMYNQLFTLHALVMVCGAIGVGWVMHNTSLDLQAGIGIDFAIFAVHLLGLSSVTSAINTVVTVLNLRAPGMPLMKMPLFVWSWLITAFSLILVMPVFSAAVTMLL